VLNATHGALNRVNEADVLIRVSYFFYEKMREQVID
jgi:hypothetical protein